MLENPKQPTTSEPTQIAFTLSELADCAKREVRFRMNNYPRWIENKQTNLTKKQAIIETQKMAQIASLLEELVKFENRQPKQK